MQIYKTRYREAEVLVKDYDGAYDNRIHIMMGPTQSMTCTPAMLKETRNTADRLGVGITIHVAEDLAEVEGCIRLYGKTPVELLYDTGMLGEDVVLAHCVFISGHSQVFIRDTVSQNSLDKTRPSIYRHASLIFSTLPRPKPAVPHRGFSH